MLKIQNPEFTRHAAEDDLVVKSSDEAYPSRNQSTLNETPRPSLGEASEGLPREFRVLL